MKIAALTGIRRLGRRFLHFYITRAGKMMIIGTFLAAVITLALPIYVAFTCFIFLFATALLTGLLFRPRMLIHGELPDRIVAGREVQTLVSDFQQKGIYTIDFNCDNLPTGAYFYKLHAGSKVVETKKMLILK